MAQFSHADFGGMSQWLPGMWMVRHVQHAAKGKARRAVLRYRGASRFSGSASRRMTVADLGPVARRSQTRSADWRPAGLGRPGAVGAQTDVRYPDFPGTRRAPWSPPPTSDFIPLAI
jgi:hypothetical protein